MGQVASLSRIMIQHILPYFIKNVPIHFTLWISFLIHHITIERESEGSSSGPHGAPNVFPQTIQLELVQHKIG